MDEEELIKKGKIQPNCEQGGQPAASVWVHFLPESPSIPVRTTLIHLRGPGCPLAHTAPTRADKLCVLAHVLTVWWWFSADNLSIFVAPFLGEEAEQTEGWRTKRGGVGAAMGFKCTDHTRRESPAVHQIFTFGN